MYSKHDKPMKLPKVYNYPKLYIKFAFYDDGLRNCSLATTKFKPYRSAHSNSLALCATYNSRIKSLEDFERAIKFISDSFDTLNLTSMYDERWHKSFKKLVAQINNDAKSLVPEKYICQRCGNLFFKKTPWLQHNLVNAKDHCGSGIRHPGTQPVYSKGRQSHPLQGPGETTLDDLCDHHRGRLVRKFFKCQSLPG